MKTSTLLKGILPLFFIFSFLANQLSAQSLVASPVTISQPLGSNTATADITRSAQNTWPGSGNFTWAVSSSSGSLAGITSPSFPFQQQNGSTQTVTFNSSAVAGTVYTFSVSRGGTTRTATVTITAPPAASVSITPTPAASVNVGGSVSFTATASNFAGSGTITYTWSVSPGTPGVEYTIPAGNSNSKSITFNAAGDYAVSVVASRSSSVASSSETTVTVFQPNLFSTSGTGTIKAYKINPVTGTVSNGPVDLITPSSSTAGLGKNKANVNDPNGNLYYILNTSNNNGQVQIYSVSPSGTGNTSVGSIDMNGGSDNTSLGFVRIGFDANGKGWIIAGDGTANIYIASFQGNGTNAISNINTYNNTPLIFNGGGSAADFQNGDLAVGPNGVLYALANVTGADTYIYTLNSLITPTTLTRKWTVQTGGAPFTGTSVNGVAWTQTGSLHVSTGTGLYFIDQTTANAVSGTVQSFLISSISGLTDLASSEFPSNSTLPVAFGEISVKKSGSNAEVTWTTLSESNNDYFIVERSEDGISFKAAGTVNGKGNSGSKQTYSYLDPLNSSAKVLYYRLRQVDMDGKTNFSNTVSLRLNGMKLNNYAVYPNPFVSDIKLQIETEKQTEMNVRISNTSGQVVVIKNVNLQKGDNIVVLSNLTSLKPGMYIVEMISADWKQTLRVTKQ